MHAPAQVQRDPGTPQLWLDVAQHHNTAQCDVIGALAPQAKLRWQRAVANDSNANYIRNSGPESPNRGGASP